VISVHLLTVLRKFRRDSFLGGLLEPRRRALLVAELSDACKETFELCFVIRFSSRLAPRFFRLAHTCALRCASSWRGSRVRIIVTKIEMSTRYQYIRTGLNYGAEALRSACSHRGRGCRAVPAACVLLVPCHCRPAESPRSAPPRRCAP